MPEPGPHPRQHAAPYLEALQSFAGREPRRAMVPGHKGGRAADGGLREALSDGALALDLPTLIEGVDVAAGGVAPYEVARGLAADAWGARRTWFLTNGASQGNLAACLAIAQRGDRVVVQRTVHGSTIDGLVLAGLEPTFVAPEVDVELGLAHCVLPSALDAALARTPGAAAAIVVSPTYYGAAADVAGLARVAHAHGVPLVVDEAWGAHLAFCEALPQHALAAGADLVISSTHKHAGSLTQSAMLHLGAGGRFEEAAVDRALGLVTSTSPSSLLLASLDAARRHAAVEGGDLLRVAVAELAVLRGEIRAIGGLDVLDERVVGRFGVAAIDPLRVCVDVRATGLSGYEVARRMRRDGDVHVELCGEHVVVAVFGLGERVAVHGARLVEALARACAQLPHRAPATGRSNVGRPPSTGGRTDVRRVSAWLVPLWGDVALSPRAAFLAAPERVPIAQAEGRIAAECLAAYPPGIPNVLPGERLTAANLATLQRTLAHGGVVRGAADPTLRTLLVVAEPAALETGGAHLRLERAVA
ncbi:MAG TPA: aminotransferase class I/II-fold pyridoxal phosphate-dependent enzyme [Solirubrobacteraceae bacterium]